MLGSLIHMDASDMVRIRAGCSDGIDIVFTDNCIGHIPKRVNSAGIAQNGNRIAEYIIRDRIVVGCCHWLARYYRAAGAIHVPPAPAKAQTRIRRILKIIVLVGYVRSQENHNAGIAPEHLTGIAEEIIRYSKIFACAFYTDVVLLFVAELAFIAPLVADINMLGMSYQNGGAGQIINDVAVHYGVSDIVD